jgi:hypothetical protein
MEEDGRMSLKDEVVEFPFGERLIPEEKLKEAVLLFKEFIENNDIPAKNLIEKYKEIFGDWEE